MKQEYIDKINELMEKCNDVALLDLIYQLLNKSNRIAESEGNNGKKERN